MDVESCKLIVLLLFANILKVMEVDCHSNKYESLSSLEIMGVIIKKIPFLEFL